MARAVVACLESESMCLTLRLELIDRLLLGDDASSHRYKLGAHGLEETSAR